MASDPLKPAPVVLADSSGVHLVAVPGDPDRRDRWEAFKVDARGAVHGPNLLGNWFRFNPSDYRESGGPYPPAVEQLRASLLG